MKIPFHLPDRRLFAGIAIGVLVGVIAVGAVTAASPAPTGPSGATGAPVAGGASRNGVAKLGLKIGALRQAIGKNFRVAVTATGKDGTHDLLYVRGTLDVGAGGVTVTLPDTSTQSFAVDATTVVREKGKTITFADLKDGERAMVFGTKNADGTYTAKLIRCVKEPKAAAAPSAAATP